MAEYERLSAISLGTSTSTGASDITTLLPAESLEDEGNWWGF